MNPSAKGRRCAGDAAVTPMTETFGPIETNDLLTGFALIATIVASFINKPARVGADNTERGLDRESGHRMDGVPPLVAAYIGHILARGQSRISGRLSIAFNALQRPPPRHQLR